jgi:hypothetical protein
VGSRCSLFFLGATLIGPSPNFLEHWPAVPIEAPHPTLFNQSYSTHSKWLPSNPPPPKTSSPWPFIVKVKGLGKHTRGVPVGKLISSLYWNDPHNESSHRVSYNGS